jgi:hypothetical protein
MLLQLPATYVTCPIAFQTSGRLQAGATVGPASCRSFPNRGQDARATVGPASCRSFPSRRLEAGATVRDHRMGSNRQAECESGGAPTTSSPGARVSPLRAER